MIVIAPSLHDRLAGLLAQRFLLQAKLDLLEPTCGPGFVPGAPSWRAGRRDAIAALVSICGTCARKGMVALPFVRGHEYRVIVWCGRCGRVEEAW